MAGYKTVFRNIRGRIIPIRESLKERPSELQKVVHVQKAREALKFLGSAADFVDRKLTGAFYRSAVAHSKNAGKQISKRMARLKKMGKI